jgi:hypothetical protein
MDLVRGLEEAGDPGRQLNPAVPGWGRWPSRPGVVTRPGHRQQPRHPGDRGGGLLRVYHLVSRHLVCCSVAKTAAAFKKNPRSIRSSAIPTRYRFSSSRLSRADQRSEAARPQPTGQATA